MEKAIEELNALECLIELSKAGTEVKKIFIYISWCIVAFFAALAMWAACTYFYQQQAENNMEYVRAIENSARGQLPKAQITPELKVINPKTDQI